MLRERSVWPYFLNMAYKINMAFLPISKEDMKERGIEQLDFVFVIGDAYVDHLLDMLL